MKLKRALSAAAICATALALTACSGTGGSPQHTSAPASAGIPASIESKGYIVLASSGSVKPLDYTNPGSSKIIGLIPDLTEAYAKKLGLKVRIERVSSDGVVPGVLSGRFDGALGIGDFTARRTTLSFVDILAGGQVLLVQKGNPHKITGFGSLCGHSVAILAGSEEQIYITKYQTQCQSAGKQSIDVQVYNDGPTAVLALKSGRVDVDYDDISDANALIQEQPKLYQIAGKYQWLAPYGVGVPKDEPHLAKAIQKALQAMLDDGSYQKILAKYGQKSLALTRITINGSKF